MNYDRYFVRVEDGDLWLGYSEAPDDEGENVDYLGDVATLSDIHDKIRADQERRADA